MPSKQRRLLPPGLPGLLSLLPILMAAAQARAGEAAAQGMRQMQSDMAFQTQQRMMMNTMHFGEPKDGNAILPAYIRIFAADGAAEGMGAWYATGSKPGGAPRQSWAEVAGKRYFPEGTDSIRVWDLTGYPKDGNWVFVMARGAIEAYAFDPSEGPRYYARPGRDSARHLDQARWRPVDSLWRDWHRRWTVEADNGDPAMAIRLANAAEGDRLSEWVYRLEAACKGKRFAVADSLIAKASAISPDYPRLRYRAGICLEKQGRPEPAVEAFRRALRYAGMDEDLRKSAEKRIQDLEARAGR